MRLFVAAIFLLSGSLVAMENSFFEMALARSLELYHQGRDKNDIEYEVVLYENINKRFVGAKIYQLNDSLSLLSATKECVFYKEGAYGQHLSVQQQDQFAREMVQLFSRYAGLSFYKIVRDPVLNEVPLGTNTCALGVVQDDLMVVFQGGPSD